MTQQEIKRLKETLPEGSRIMLDHMVDDPHPIPDMTVLTVDFIDGIGQIHVKESGLTVIPDVDAWHKCRVYE
jgi:hypothetical protein